MKKPLYTTIVFSIWGAIILISFVIAIYPYVISQIQNGNYDRILMVFLAPVMLGSLLIAYQFDMKRIMEE